MRRRTHRLPKEPNRPQREVQRSKQVTDMWEELGLVEMPDTWDTDSNRSGGSCVTSDSDEEYPDVWPRQPRLR